MVAGEGEAAMIVGTTALRRALPTKARTAQGTTSRAKMLVQVVVRNTSGATLGTTHGSIVVPELKIRESQQKEGVSVLAFVTRGQIRTNGAQSSVLMRLQKMATGTRPTAILAEKIEGGRTRRRQNQE